MINKYNDFLLEGKFEDYKKEHHSIGEWIEKISENDEYIKTIVNQKIDESGPDISISNAINCLSDFDIKQLFNRVYRYITQGEKEKDVDIMTNVYINESNETFAGKNIFQSFLKSLTALGQKDKFSKETHHDFLLFYTCKSIDIQKLKSILSRFRSLSYFSGKIDYSTNECDIYYGLNLNMTFEYGFICSNKIIKIGHFGINKSNLQYLLMLKSSSSNTLKHDLVITNYDNIKLMCKISTDMKSYELSNNKKGPLLKEGILTFSYYGVGKWNNSILEDHSNIKEEFKNWVMRYKWYNKVLLSITYNDYWININFKLK